MTDWVENATVDLKNYDNVPSFRFAFRYSDGNIWAYGTAIDNVRFGRADEIVNPNPTDVSEPGTILSLVGLGTLAMTFTRKRQQA